MTTARLRYFIVLILCFTGVAAFAQKAEVSAKLDSTSLLIGQQTRLHFFVHGPKDMQVNFPVIPDSITKGVQVVRLEKTDTIADKDEPGMQVIRRNYLITSFDAGNYTIPSFTFKADKDSLQSNPVTLEVHTVKVDTTKAIYDIKQPIAVSYTFLDWLRDHWWWVALPLVLIAVIIGLFLYFKKRPAPQPVIAPVAVPVIAPHVTALAKLEQLRGKKLWQADMVKEYHTELTDILRDYIEARYRVTAHEKTTEELFAGLRYSGIDNAEQSRLHRVFVLADLVKFAKEKPLPADNEQSLDDAIAFVRSTQQQPAREGGAQSGVA